jgi:choline dehydrogenase-like flavoprotein
MNDPNQGRVKAGFPNFFFPQSLTFMKTFIGLNFTPALDLSNGNIVSHVGLSSDTLTPANNTRCSAVCGFVTPFADGKRPNLSIVTGAMVSRIVWDEEKRKMGLLVAKQVEYFVNGNSTPKYADINTDSGGEVVLAAGTIGTPKVMELSGVGNSRCVVYC